MEPMCGDGGAPYIEVFYEDKISLHTTLQNIIDFLQILFGHK